MLIDPVGGLDVDEVGDDVGADGVVGVVVSDEGDEGDTSGNHGGRSLHRRSHAPPQHHHDPNGPHASPGRRVSYSGRASDVQLRAAIDADWPDAWGIQRDAFEALVIRTAGGWDPDQIQRCAEAWDPANTQIVEVDGRMVGWLRIEHHADHDWLDLVVIAPSDQGRGLGTAVMRHLMAEATARGVPLWLSVYRTNEARHLYARLGFTARPRDEIRLIMVFGAPADARPPRGPPSEQGRSSRNNP